LPEIPRILNGKPILTSTAFTGSLAEHVRNSEGNALREALIERSCQPVIKGIRSRKDGLQRAELPDRYIRPQRIVEEAVRAAIVEIGIGRGRRRIPLLHNPGQI